MRLRSFFAIAAAFMIVIAAWAVFHETTSNFQGASKQSDSTFTGVLSGLAEAEDEQQHTAQGKQGRKSVGALTGSRQIVVVDESDKVIPGVTVHCLLASDSDAQSDSLREFIQAQSDVDVELILMSQQVVETDDQGSATLPPHQLGIVACAHEDMRGALKIDTQSDSTLQLVMRRQPHHRVQVLDHGDQPVAGVALELQLVDAMELKQSIHDGERHLFRNPLCTPRVTNDDGIAWLPLALSPSSTDLIREREQGEQVVINVQLPFRTMLYAEIDPHTSSEVIMRLPTLGEAFVRLSDYPEGSHARLRENPGPGSFFYQVDAMPEPLSDASGFRHYRFVPLGIELLAFINAVPPGEQDFSELLAKELQLPGHRFAGPVAASEPLRIELGLQQRGLIQCKLSDLDGNPLTFNKDWNDSVCVHAFRNDGAESSQFMQAELLEGGRLIASTRFSERSEASERSLKDIQRLRIQYFAGSLPEGLEGRANHLWADVDVSAEGASESLQLGEIQLGQSDALALELSAVDSLGHPVAGARVTAEYEWRNRRGDLDWEEIELERPFVRTGRTGSVYFLHEFWNPRQPYGEMTGRYRVRVAAEGFAQAVVPLAAESKSLVVELQESQSLVGEVVLPPGVEGVSVLAISESVSEGGAVHSVRQNLQLIAKSDQGRSDSEATHRFELAGLSQSTYKLEFRLRQFREPLLELNGVQPSSSSDQAIQVDLRPTLRIFEFEFGLPGERVNGPGLLKRGLRGTYIVESPFSIRRNSIALKWEDPVMRCVCPRDASGRLIFTMPGMEVIEIDRDSPRYQRLQFAELPITYFLVQETPHLEPGHHLELRISNPSHSKQQATAVHDHQLSDGWAFQLSRPGQYRLSWYIVNEAGVQLDSAADGLTVTEAQLGSTEPIVLRVPDRLMKADED